MAWRCPAPTCVAVTRKAEALPDSTERRLAGFGDPCERCDIDDFTPGGGINSRGHAGTVSASAALPAQPARAARRVFRRCAKAASMTANTCSRVAEVTGGSRRVKATSPEWIFGAGQKTFMPITPALRMLLYQAAFTDGTP